MKELFSQYYGPLCYFASKLIGDDDAAKDIVQEAFVCLWRVGRVRQVSRPDAWLYTVVRHDCYKYMADIERGNAITPPMEHAEMDSSHALILAELGRELQAAIRQLPPRTRTIIRMYYEEDKSLREIAEALHLHISTVKTQKTRGIQSLRKILEKARLLLPLLWGCV